MLRRRANAARADNAKPAFFAEWVLTAAAGWCRGWQRSSSVMRAGKHELSSLPPAALGQAPGAGENDPAPQHVPQPTTSLLSTAMRPASPPPQPASPPAQHAGSVVSQTALARGAAKPALARAGTPASVYGQGQEAGRERAASPQGSHATEQARCACPLCRAPERSTLALSPFGGRCRVVPKRV